MKELIEKEIGDIPICGNKYYVADGAWSLFELIGYVLDKLGPSNVFITSFSLSEESIRYLHHLKEIGQILSLRGLFDPSLRKTKTPLLYFAASVFCDIRFTANHSKIILFENPVRNFVICASANLGRNRRIETGILDADAASYDYLKEKLFSIFNQAIPL